MPAQDAYDPGENLDYPYFPRLESGEPALSFTEETDGVQVPGWGGVPVTPVPTGIRYQTNWRTGVRTMIDMTPRAADGTPLVIPKRVAP